MLQYDYSTNKSQWSIKLNFTKRLHFINSVFSVKMFVFYPRIKKIIYIVFIFTWLKSGFMSLISLLNKEELVSKHKVFV